MSIYVQQLRRLLASFVVLWLAFSQPIAAQNLTVQMKTLQDQFYTYEPLFVDVVVINRTGTNQSVVAELEYETQTISAEYRLADEPWTRVSIGIVSEPSGRKILLADGDQHIRSQMLAYDAVKNGPLFDRPGNWQLRTVMHRFDVIDGDIYSEPVDIRVNPLDAGNEAAAELFSDPKIVQLAQGFYETNVELKALEAFIKRAGNTRFSAYAKLFLAQRLMEENVGRDPDPVRANRLLNEISQNTNAPLQITQEVLRASARAGARSGDLQGASQASEQLIKLAGTDQNLEVTQRVQSIVEVERARLATEALKDTRAVGGGNTISRWLYILLIIPIVLVVSYAKKLIS